MEIDRVKLVPVRGVDFSEIVKDEKFKHVLLLFNDSLQRHETSEATAGSAAIRPYNHCGDHKEYPRSFGISTFCQEKGAFKTINDAKSLPTECCQLRQLLLKHKYTEVWFPADEAGKFATRKDAGVGEEVIDYLMALLNYYTHPIDGSFIYSVSTH